MKKKMVTKLISYLLTAAMITGTYVCVGGGTVEAQAAVVTKNVNLNVNNSIAGIENPDKNATSAWTGTTVYCGKRAYYVLDKDGGIGGHSSKSGHMLLLSKGVLAASGRNFDDSNSNWSNENCDIRTYLNGDEFLNNTGIFTGIEKSAIGETTIDNANTDDGNYFSYPDGTTNDKIFLLDLGDVENANYGFTSDDNTRVATDPNCTERWWLRSPGIHGDFAASVRDSGSVIPGGFYVYYAVGSARPALNLKLSSVLFSSASGTDKPTDFLETTDSSATTWKLTLKDGNNTFAAKRTDAGDLSVGASVTVDVTGFGSKTNTDYSKLSVMLVDSDNTVLAYGPTDCEVSTGEKIFTIPSYSGTASKLYIFGEKLSGGNLTDYASNMVDITTKAPNPQTPTPSEDNHINNDSSHSDNQPSGSKKNEDTYVNPLSWLYHGTQAGSLCTMEHQGTVCQAAFLAATPAGYREAFSFNLSTKENGVMTTSSSKKTGKFTMNIPKEYQKSGRTFALIGIDKYGHIKIFTDEDLSDESITVTLDLEGYAFSLIYTDGATLTGSQSGQTATGSNICTVKEGDTLSQIARNLGVSRKHLIEKNKLTNPDRIKTGQKLSY